MVKKLEQRVIDVNRFLETEVLTEREKNLIRGELAFLDEIRCDLHNFLNEVN